MKKHNILFTCVGGTLAMDSIIELKKDSNLNLFIIGVDSKAQNFNSNFLEKFYQVPNGDDINYFDKIFDICIKHRIELILPGSDEEAFTLSKNNHKLAAKGIKISCCSFEHHRLITNKAKLYEFLNRQNIRVPRYRLINQNFDLEIEMKTILKNKSSVVIKNMNTRGGRGTFFIENELDPIPAILKNGSREKVLSSKTMSISSFKEIVGKECLIMEVFMPLAYDVDVLVQNGKVVEFLIRERINPCGIPYMGSIIRKNKKIENYIKSICNALEIDGILDLDLMTDKNDSIQLLEINPRMSGSISASYASNFPILSKGISLLLGEYYPNNFKTIPNKEIYLGTKSLNT